MRTLPALLLAALLLTGCALPARLVPGSSTGSEAEQSFGPPAMRLPRPAGGEILVYPNGPAGYQTWFLHFDSAGRFVQQENVLDSAHFTRVKAGMSDEEILALLGPPVPHWTMYFAARDELVWEWRYCNDWNEPARFDVMFDATTRRVRSTYAASEELRDAIGFSRFRGWCSH